MIRGVPLIVSTSRLANFKCYNTGGEFEVMSGHNLIISGILYVYKH